MLQSSLLDVPPGFSIEKPNTIEEFIIKGKAALASVGLVKDNSYVGKTLSTSFVFYILEYTEIFSSIC